MLKSLESTRRIIVTEGTKKGGSIMALNDALHDTRLSECIKVLIYLNVNLAVGS